MFQEESRAFARLASPFAPAASTPPLAMAAMQAILTHPPITAATSIAPALLSALFATSQERSAAKLAKLAIT